MSGSDGAVNGIGCADRHGGRGAKTSGSWKSEGLSGPEGTAVAHAIAHCESVMCPRNQNTHNSICIGGLHRGEQRSKPPG
eukprot:3976477-Pleurochrysis_carterae.AAC.1